MANNEEEINGGLSKLHQCCTYSDFKATFLINKH